MSGLDAEQLDALEQRVGGKHSVPMLACGFIV
jgi:hypothetical protein